jgi:hypothetical protein
MLICRFQGLGENIRGTALGAIDTFTGDGHGEACNDDIARTGRQEFSEGMAKIRGQGKPPGGPEAKMGMGLGEKAPPHETQFNQGDSKAALGQSQPGNDRKGAYHTGNTLGDKVSNAGAGDSIDRHAPPSVSYNTETQHGGPHIVRDVTRDGLVGLQDDTPDKTNGDYCSPFHGLNEQNDSAESNPYGNDQDQTRGVYQSPSDDWNASVNRAHDGRTEANPHEHNQDRTREDDSRGVRR